MAGRGEHVVAHLAERNADIDAGLGDMTDEAS